MFPIRTSLPPTSLTPRSTLQTQVEEVPCDVCNRKAEGQQGTFFNPQICYSCVQRINYISKNIFCRDTTE